MDSNREGSPHSRMDLLEEVVGNFVRAVGDQMSPAESSQQGPRGERTMAELFSKQKPSEFQGEVDPMVANHWVMDMERIFRIVNCSDQQKIICAANMLKGEAQDRWVNILEQGTPTNWEKFKEEFYKRFFPLVAQRQKICDFKNLQQGNMTVTEYIDQFNALLRLAWRTFPTKAERARKYEEGLRGNIRSRVETHQYPTAAQV